MKKNAILSMLLVLVMIVGGTAFAGIDPNLENVPLESKQKILFTLEDSAITVPQSIHELEYDPANQQLYIIVRLDSMSHWDASNQYVYDINNPEGNEIDDPAYPLIEGYLRQGIEFGDTGAWSLEQGPGGTDYFMYHAKDGVKSQAALDGASGLVVQGNHVLYRFPNCSSRDDFLTGTIVESPDTENLVLLDLESPIDAECTSMRGYDLSPDGKEVLYLSFSRDEDSDVWVSHNDIVRVDLETKEEIARFPFVTDSMSRIGFDLYATDQYIVVLSKDYKTGKGYIDRYTYDGVRVDGVETNYCIRRITEGPNGSTIYMQMKYLDEKFVEVDQEEDKKEEFGPLEVIQVNWEPEKEISDGSGPRPVIREKTRAGYTVARFADSKFGLLRVEELETGMVDYQAPIRSNENAVKLQIPYFDIKAKMESGARNLLVDYQDQELVFPMELFNCDDVLAAMPCQSDATIEIIMHTDEAGNVTYDVQLFVVEQVNGMTRVVHRKTIQ